MGGLAANAARVGTTASSDVNAELLTRSTSPTQAPTHHQPTPTHASSSQQDLFVFKKNLLSILNKFAGQHTQQQAADELKRLMKVEITDNDRMIIFLSCLANIDEHMSIS